MKKEPLKWRFPSKRGGKGFGNVFEHWVQPTAFIQTQLESFDEISTRDKGSWTARRKLRKSSPRVGERGWRKGSGIRDEAGERNGEKMQRKTVLSRSESGGIYKQINLHFGGFQESFREKSSDSIIDVPGAFYVRVGRFRLYLLKKSMAHNDAGVRISFKGFESVIMRAV